MERVNVELTNLITHKHDTMSPSIHPSSPGPAQHTQVAADDDPKFPTGSGGNLASKHVARDTSDGRRSSRARIRSMRTIGSRGPPPADGPDLTGLAIRAVGGLGPSSSWLLLLRCRASCSPVQFFGSDSPPCPHLKDPNLGSGFHHLRDSRGDLATTFALPIFSVAESLSPSLSLRLFLVRPLSGVPPILDVLDLFL